MPHIFRLYDNGPTNLENWDITNQIGDTNIQKIKSTVTTGTTGKIGSSIPSVFARLQLFDSAFKSVVLSDNFDQDTIDHLLVSDCLDLLQFLFMYGNHKDITYEIWDKSTRLEALESRENEKHQNLAKVLKMFLNKKPFNKLTQFIFIKYKGILVGGTSPYTLVFTSPNWKRKLKEFSFQYDPKFKTNTEDIIFDDIPYSINRRDVNFQIYLHRLCQANRQLFSESSLFRYIDFVSQNPKVTRLRLDEKIDDINLDELNDYYDPIEIDSANLYSGLIQLYAKGSHASEIESDYKLTPSVDYYKTEIDQDGNVKNIPTPVLLIQGYNNPGLSHNGRPWNPQTSVTDIARIPLYNRQLPEDPATNYPYLTTGDFFTTNLLKLRFNVDHSNFYTPTKDKFEFLLPIKKRYFQFFTFEDLKNNLSYKNSNGKHIFELKIKIQRGHTITVKKIYENEHIKDNDFTSGYNLAIFPFYKLLNQPNKYSIGLYENVQEIQLQFGKFNGQTLDENQMTSRLRATISNQNSWYYNLNEGFDLIEVKRRGDSGLIIPNWTVYDPIDHVGNYSFAVDFGTTNTYIAYTSDLPNSQIKEFEIDQDRQTVLFSGDQAEDISESISAFNREFAPRTISASEMPFRTMLYESITNNNNHLFEDLNIGLNFYESSILTSDNKYLSDIKWLLENNTSQHDRIKLIRFIEQILQHIKAKLILNNGKLSTKIIYTKPLSMKNSVQDALDDAWEEATKNVFKDNKVELICKTESEMPYYAIPATLMHHNVINIDIGGGTTDCYFVYKSEKKHISTSYMFAGNDIWGDGIHESGQFDNGLLSLSGGTEDKVGHLAEQIKKNPKLYSSDLSSAFFKMDDLTSFSYNLKNNEQAKLIFIIHLAAILFKVARTLDKYNLPNPNHLSFSGKGSEYIKLISRDPSNLIHALFTVFRPKTAKTKINVVHLENPKKLTANGSLLSLHSSNPIKSSVELENIKIKNLDDKTKKAINDEFKTFIELLKNESITDVLLDYSDLLTFENQSFNILDFLKDYGVDSFNGCFARYNDPAHHNPNVAIKSPLFFWHLKHSLYSLSKVLFNEME